MVAWWIRFCGKTYLGWRGRQALLLIVRGRASPSVSEFEIVESFFWLGEVNTRIEIRLTNVKDLLTLGWYSRQALLLIMRGWALPMVSEFGINESFFWRGDVNTRISSIRLTNRLIIRKNDLVIFILMVSFHGKIHWIASPQSWVAMVCGLNTPRPWG